MSRVPSGRLFPNAEPRVVALVLCSSVDVDPEGELTIKSAFQSISFADFPGRHPKMEIYIELEGLYEPADFIVTISRIEAEGEGHWRSEIQSRNRFPNGVGPLVASCPDLIFDRPGRYAIQVLTSDGRPLMDRSLYVEKRPPT